MEDHSTPIPFEDEILTPLQVAKYLKLSKTKVYEMLKRRELPVIKLGKNVRVQLSDLQEYIKRSKDNG